MRILQTYRCELNHYSRRSAIQVRLMMPSVLLLFRQLVHRQSYCQQQHRLTVADVNVVKLLQQLQVHGMCHISEMYLSQHHQLYISRSDSCSSVDASGSSSPSLFGQKQEHQSVRRIASSTPLLPPTSHNYQRTAAHRSSSTKDTAVPLIQMLQQERKMEIEKYRRMHPNKGGK